MDRLGGTRGVLGMLVLVIGFSVLLGNTIALGLSKWFPVTRTFLGDLVIIVATCVIVTFWVLGMFIR